MKIRDGKLTGEVTEPILGRAAKLATLIELRESFDLDDIDTLVTGDGANDLGMIEAAGLGVAYHAKPAVAAAAAARIDYGDLTALLYAQGYRRDEFVGEKCRPSCAGDHIALFSIRTSAASRHISTSGPATMKPSSGCTHLSVAALNAGFPAHEIGAIIRHLRTQRDLLEGKWHEHFGN